MLHKPVLLREILELLALKPGMTVVDGTLGSGGHALEILKMIGKEGTLIGLDQDPASLERCWGLVEEYPRTRLVHSNFAQLPEVLDSLNISAVDAVLIDIGFSSDQMEDPARGFSFEKDGPLDMRMNPEGPVTAWDWVNTMPQAELQRIFWEYGEERWGRRFAEQICASRRRASIMTTRELVAVLAAALPFKVSEEKGSRPSWARRHFATRVFQALRIAVNDELNILNESLTKIWNRLKTHGKLAVISFHSLEDRIVKTQFRVWHQAKSALLITKKPVTATRSEIIGNPRARSAKLRVAEKLS